jgi:RNA polymerase sigma factor (TIGR02999 family)
MHPAVSGPGAVTVLLGQLRAGEPETLDRLIDLIYPELRALARTHLNREHPGHLLQPTALVNEAYLRLVGHHAHNWQNRAHFFGAASRLMRRILVDFARAEHAGKRGAGEVAVPLEDSVAVVDRSLVDILALDDALTALEQLSPRQARIVQLRYFGGLSTPEVAEVLGITVRTVGRDWATARAWLRLRLTP